MKGSLYILVAAGTRDEAYYYSSIKKEEKMHESLNKISDDLNNPQEMVVDSKSSQIDTSKWEKIKNPKHLNTSEII